MTLARDLGKTRDELLDAIGNQEFVDWIALYEIEAEELKEQQREMERKAKSGR